MMENQHDVLPSGSDASRFVTRIRPFGYRLPFQTQASGTIYTNAMCDVIGVYGMD